MMSDLKTTTEAQVKDLNDHLNRTEADFRKANNESLKQVQALINENSHLKNTTQQITTQLVTQNSLDDNINILCFLDSYLAFEGY